MIFCIIMIFLIPVVDLIMMKFTEVLSHTLCAHFFLVLFGVCGYVYMYSIILIEQLYSIHLIPAIFCVVCGILIYILDLAVKNMILHEVLILDWLYYFRPKKQMYISVLISLLIGCSEELIFRLPICVFSANQLILLVIGMVTYGIVHLFYSRYDAYSKIIFGLVFGICVILMKNIYYSMIMHAVYNILVGLFGGKDYYNSKKGL